MQNSYQPVVTAALVALLIAVNIDEFKGIGGALIGQGDSTFKQDVLSVGKSGIAVAIIAMLAGVSPDLGKISLALTGGLWLLFLMHPGGHKERASRQPNTNTDQLFYGKSPLR